MQQFIQKKKAREIATFHFYFSYSFHILFLLLNRIFKLAERFNDYRSQFSLSKSQVQQNEEFWTYLPKYRMSKYYKENAMSIYFVTLNLSKVSRRKRKNANMLKPARKRQACRTKLTQANRIQRLTSTKYTKYHTQFHSYLYR